MQKQSERCAAEPLRVRVRRALPRQARHDFLPGARGEQRTTIRAAVVLMQRRRLLGCIAFYYDLVVLFGGMDESNTKRK